MLKDFFNRPADPSRDKDDHPYLSRGDVLAIAGYTAIIIGGAFAAVEVAVEIVDYLRPEAHSVVEPVTTGAVQYPQSFVQKKLG
ncbi:MAG: hypothetical protein WC989_02950 [Micavibrio sp.]